MSAFDPERTYAGNRLEWSWPAVSKHVLDPDGNSRRRQPAAWKTALAIAGATPVIETSPRPFAPALLNWRSGLAKNPPSMEPMSAFTGTTYSARSAFRKPPY